MVLYKYDLRQLYIFGRYAIRTAECCSPVANLPVPPASPATTLLPSFELPPLVGRIFYLVFDTTIAFHIILTVCLKDGLSIVGLGNSRGTATLFDVFVH